MDEWLGLHTFYWGLLLFFFSLFALAWRERGFSSFLLAYRISYHTVPLLRFIPLISVKEQRRAIRSGPKLFSDLPIPYYHRMPGRVAVAVSSC